jgi:hypothetical protein
MYVCLCVCVKSQWSNQALSIIKFHQDHFHFHSPIPKALSFFIKPKNKPIPTLRNSLHPNRQPTRTPRSRLFRPSTIGSCRAFHLDRPQSERAKTFSGLEFEELASCVELRLFLWVSCVYHLCCLCLCLGREEVSGVLMRGGRENRDRREREGEEKLTSLMILWKMFYL